jgi:hypothetical protein
MLGGSVPTDGSSNAFAATVPGQTGYFTFSGTAGQNLGFAITNVVASIPVDIRGQVLRPDGQVLHSFSCSSWASGCGMRLPTLPQTGTYSITIPSKTSLLSYILTLSPSVTGTLTSGIPLSLPLNSPGQYAVLDLSIASTQTVVLTLSSVATHPAGKTVTASVYNSSGALVATKSSTAASWTLTLSNLAAGTYSAVVVLADGATSTLQIGF